VQLFAADCAVAGSAAAAGGVVARNGGLLVGQNLTAVGLEGDLLPRCFEAVGSGSVLRLVGGATIAELGDSGYYVDAGGAIGSGQIAATNCGVGFHVASGGGTIEQAGGASIGNDQDLLIEASNARFATGGLFHEGKLSIAAGATTVFGLLSDSIGEKIGVIGDFAVGTRVSPAATCLGQGCASNEGMTAFHYDGVVWTDVTAELSSPSGSEVAVVPGTGLGNYLYVGAPEPFSALQLLVTLVQTGGTLTPEYYKDGVGWTAVDWMISRDNEAHGNELFAATGPQDKRLGATPDWVATTENSVNAYWYRIGVTSALTTAPRLEQLLLHYSYTRIGGKGAVEVFGDEEPEHEIDADLSKWVTENGAALPNSVVLGYSANVSKAVQSYPSSAPRGCSYELDYPSDADTSRPMRLILEASSSNADVATYVMALYHVRVPPGSTLNGGLAGEVPTLKIVTPTGTANQTQLLEYQILRPEAISGTDRLCLTLRRETNDANDTHTGAVQLSKATLLYSRWKP
jgi:hypothetical protein